MVDAPIGTTLDPALRVRLLRQLEKEESGESLVEDVKSLADPLAGLAGCDDQLLRALKRQKEKCQPGEELQPDLKRALDHFERLSRNGFSGASLSTPPASPPALVRRHSDTPPRGARSSPGWESDTCSLASPPPQGGRPYRAQTPPQGGQTQAGSGTPPWLVNASSLLRHAPAEAAAPAPAKAEATQHETEPAVKAAQLEQQVEELRLAAEAAEKKRLAEVSRAAELARELEALREQARARPAYHVGRGNIASPHAE